jgi:hypothetical protein
MIKRTERHEPNMKTDSQERASRLSAHKALAVETLKQCPLCDAVNAVTNDECFQCSWHGDFIFDPVKVEAGLSELLSLCPELADAMVRAPLPGGPVSRRLRYFWYRVRVLFSTRRSSRK